MRKSRRGTGARAAARRFVEWAWQSIAKHGRFNVALSGGSTPRELYRLLASTEYRLQVDWPLVHLYWSDERAVPPDHPDSNYGMARRELILRVPIPPNNVHRMEAEAPNIGRAAHNYEALLRRSLEIDELGLPRFHLILLGMGCRRTHGLALPRYAPSRGKPRDGVSTRRWLRSSACAA